MARSLPDLAELGEGDAAGYLARLATSAVTVIAAPEYARIVFDLARRRALMALGHELAETAATVAETDGFAETDGAAGVLAAHEGRLNDFLQGAADGSGETGPLRWCDEVDAAAREWEAAQKGEVPPGLPFGLAELDAATGGLFAGDLILIGARPSMGKTALALGIAIAAAERCRAERSGTVLFCSLEQPGRQLVTRDAAAASGIAMPAVRAGRLDDADLKRLVDTAFARRSLPILLDSRGGLSVGRIAATARRQRRRDGLRLIVVDYLQILGFDDRYRGNRTYEVAEATRALKALAKELDVPVVLLSQLNRAVETRDSRRPQLADLRESGSIEQDADAVLLLHREDYYLERDGEPARRADDSDDDHQQRLAQHRAHRAEVAGLADIVIAKQRNGPCKTIAVRFDPQRMRFSDLERGST